MILRRQGSMGRHAANRGRKPRPQRHEFAAISIVDVAREGLLKPGSNGAGFCKSLCGRVGEIAGWVPIRCRIDANEGVVTLFEPWEQEVRVEARPTRARYRQMWYFECWGAKGLGDCGRFVRKLFRPHAPTASCQFGIWACSRCHGIAYPRVHAHNVARQHEHLRSLEALIRECLKMHEIAKRCLADESLRAYVAKHGCGGCPK
jgi:hypothetical protein